MLPSRGERERERSWAYVLGGDWSKASELSLVIRTVSLLNTLLDPLCLASAKCPAFASGEIAVWLRRGWGCVEGARTPSRWALCGSSTALGLWGFRVAGFFSVSVAAATFGCSCFCASCLVPPPFTLLSKNCGISCPLILTFLLSLFFWVFLFFHYEKERRK